MSPPPVIMLGRATNNSKPSVKIPFKSNGGFGNDGVSNAELTARRIAFGI